MKNRILIISAVLAISCFIMVIISGQKVNTTRKDLEQERYNRMIAEEKLEKALLKVKSLENELTNAQNQTQGIQTVLEKEKVANAALKTELEKVTKLKEVLEQELKNALVQPAQPPPPAGQ